MDVFSKPLPGSSSSSSSQMYHHDVFLCYRGCETGNSFTDHLNKALLDADINTFLGDEAIKTVPKSTWQGAIISSRFSIIVLSKNYASSTSCLDELVLILEQRRNFNQIVIPIFYHVEPSHVRKQQSSFGEAMEKHKQRMEKETNAEKRSQLAHKIDLWKGALTEVADLKGINAEGRRETEIIDEVVTGIQCKLDATLGHALPLLVGMDHYIQLISSWLTDGSCHATDILTIVGMGGIGKTHLAKFLFQKHSAEFLKSSFIEGINLTCNPNSDGSLDPKRLPDFQMQLLADISRKFPLQVNDVSVYTSKIEKALACKRVFIVLDDIGSLDQLDALLGNNGLHPGSKVIITTKDASLTQRCALFDQLVPPNHTNVFLKGLCKTDALKLLCIHAFKSHVPEEGYEEVSEKLVKYCDGHPLALQVLGKSLHKRDVAYWEDRIQELKEETDSHIKEVLQMSYYSLKSINDKELFKHIACFFVGKDIDFAQTILEACGIRTRSGIKNLIDRCLLSSGVNKELAMHPLIQEMGKDLVREEYSKKPWKRSRLWCHEESLEVLKEEKGTGNLLGLALDMKMLDKEKTSELKIDWLGKMYNLMLLQLNNVRLSGPYKNFPQKLRWLCMHGYALKSIPLDLPMENLIALDMSYSNIESFDMSKDKRLLGSLKILNLSFCEQLHSIGGFVELPALERLIVRNCISLVEVGESIEQCVELVHIDMSNCYKLKRVPISKGKLKKDITLLLDGCDFREPQIEMWDTNLSDIISINSQTSSSTTLPVASQCLRMCLENNPYVSVPSYVGTRGVVKLKPES